MRALHTLDRRMQAGDRSLLAGHEAKDIAPRIASGVRLHKCPRGGPLVQKAVLAVEPEHDIGIEHFRPAMRQAFKLPGVPFFEKQPQGLEADIVLPRKPLSMSRYKACMFLGRAFSFPYVQPST